MTRCVVATAAGLVLLTCGCGAIDQAWNTTPETSTETAPSPDSSAPAAGKATSGTNLIRLSAGTALPQSLPTGTTMHFSVDYRVRGKPADSAAQFFWVIQRAMGPEASIPVQLKAKGTLTQLNPGWRTEQGPFRCHISIRSSSGQMTRVSPTVSLI